MSKTFIFAANENVLSDGPTYALRSGNKSRNETDRDLFPPVVLGWPNRTEKQLKNDTQYRETGSNSTENENSQDQITLDDSDQKENTKIWIEPELETSFKNLSMASNDRIMFSREQRVDETALKERNSAYLGESDNIEEKQTIHSENDLCTVFEQNEHRDEPLNEKQAVAMAKAIFSVSDTVIAPKAFTGKTSDGDAESWLEFFELYCKHRGLNPTERLTLFPLMMRNGAADWLATLTKTQLRSYDDLVTAFRDNYFVPAELRWREAGLLWNQCQKDDESVEEFVTRVRRGARRINLAETQLADIILNGLRPSIRMHVLQRRGDLTDLIKTAKLAEAVAPPSNDTTNALLLKYIQKSVEANEKQSDEIQKLTSKINALTRHNEETDINAVETNKTNIGQQQRFVRQTPQNLQRANYARDFNTRTPQGSAAGFLPRARINFNANDAECDRCGRHHARVSRCPAYGMQCRACQKLNHFAAKCRSTHPSASRPLQPTAPQQQ